MVRIEDLGLLARQADFLQAVREVGGSVAGVSADALLEWLDLNGFATDLIRNEEGCTAHFDAAELPVAHINVRRDAEVVNVSLKRHLLIKRFPFTNVSLRDELNHRVDDVYHPNTNAWPGLPLSSLGEWKLRCQFFQLMTWISAVAFTADVLRQEEESR